MLPLLCRILILRKISSEYVLNNEGQKIFLVVAPKVTRLQIFNTRLWQVYWYQRLSLDENDFHTKNDHILGMQKDGTSSSSLSFILGANCRYIFILKNAVRRIRS